jgi:hypothetical protein
MMDREFAVSGRFQIAPAFRPEYKKRDVVANYETGDE